MKYSFNFLMVLLLVILYTTSNIYCDDLPTIPGTPQAYQATFTKTSIFWDDSSDDIGIIGYKVYRDNVEIATVTEPLYNDSALTSDTQYTYTIKAVDTSNQLSQESSPLILNTLQPLDVEDASTIEQVVDSVNVEGLSASEIITSVQNAFATLGYDPTFDKIDIFLLTELVQKRIDELNETYEPETPESRIADQQELDDLLIDHFEGNSFLTLYIHSNLVELAEKHFQDGNSESALTLYDSSLNYLHDVESSVSNTLHRISYIKLHSITDQTDTQEKINTLHDSKNTLIRFFDFFPSSISHLAQGLYTKAAFNYFAHFPELLQYDLYHQDIYDSALSMITAAKTMDNSTLNAIRLDRISSWELSNATISIQTPTGTPIAGDITITNVSGASRYIDEPLEDVRSFSATSAITQTPLYLGHIYNVTIKADVQGGNQWVWNINDIPHPKGKKITYDHGTGPTITDLTDPNAPAKIIFISSQPTAPYNLYADRFIDTFTLLWDWISPTGFNLKEFKVFRSGTAIGTVTTQTMIGIPFEIDNNSYSYTVIAYDTNDNPSDTSLPITVTPNFTDEQQAYFDWLQEHFGDDAVYDYEDNDNDGLANYYEYLLGSNPNLAPVDDIKSILQSVIPGLKTSYYSGIWSSIPDFSALTPTLTEALASPNFDVGYNNILNSGLADYVGVVYEGYLDIPQDGVYNFFLTSADGSKLILNDMILINNDGRHGLYLKSNSVYLKQGAHKLRIEYFDYTGWAALKLEWSGPDFGQQEIPEANLWHTEDINNQQLEEYFAMRRDLDGDGLPGYLEYQFETGVLNPDSDGDGLSDGDEVFIYDTDPLNSDSDNDGISDYDEVFSSETDPLNPDFDPEDVEDIVVVNGSNFLTSIGNWQKVSNIAYCMDRRGELEYVINLPAPNIYRLKIKFIEHYDTASSHDLRIFIDGEYIHRQVIACTEGMDSYLYAFTPHIIAGNHTVKIVWDGYQSFSSPRIKSLTMQRLGGPDENANLLPDWIDYRLNNMCNITGGETIISKTSPVCIEGRGRFLSMMTLPENIIPIKTLKNKWYTNVPLTMGVATDFDVSFQNGVKTKSCSITWEETNLLNQELIFNIRKGDSLLLNTRPEGINTGSYSIICDNTIYAADVTTPSVVAFNTAGAYTVNGTYTANDGTQQYASIEVNVIEYEFPTTTPACWNGRSRTWDIPKLPADVIVSSASNLKEFALAADQPEELTRYYLTLVGNDDCNIIARIGENGPVLTVTNVRGLDVFSSYQTYVHLIDTYEDGTKVYEMLVISSPVKADITVTLRIFISGIVFDDGSIEKSLTVTDFDELGQKKVYFLYPPEATSSVCHTLKVYQNNVYIGARY